jgi:DNA-binding NtrC family response regulator
MPFVVVDCAALPENLVESTLFGHERGAFTGADRRQDGLIRQADGGTLFLDEIGELPLAVQKSFLRVVQERRFRPVGSEHEVTSNFRLIAATNRDLDAMVASWDFRQDLLFRIRTISVRVPPLRERTGDVRLLTDHFLKRAIARDNGTEKECSPDFRDMLEKYQWPGNVRELSNAVENALARSGEERTLLPRHLPMDIRVHMARQTLSANADTAAADTTLDASNFPLFKDFREQVVGELEQKYLRDLFQTARGNVQQACTLSGLSRARLYALLKKHGLTRKNLYTPE